MQLTSIVAVLAAGLSLAVAQAADPVTGTTSSTTTIYQTVTVTRCNPEVTNCPASTPSASPTLSPVVHNAVNTTSSMTTSTTFYSAHNSTRSAGPTGTGHFTNATSSTRSSNSPGSTGTDSSASPIPTAGAAGRFVQTSLMLGLVAAGVAILA
jgi:hypothetical protein